MHSAENPTSPTQQDAAGLAQPFAAMVLVEVARADRIDQHLSAVERTELVQAGSDYLSSVRDYRGYVQKEGWRHAVAHAADLMMCLTQRKQGRRSVRAGAARCQKRAQSQLARLPAVAEAWRFTPGSVAR